MLNNSWKKFRSEKFIEDPQAELLLKDCFYNGYMEAINDFRALASTRDTTLTGHRLNQAIEEFNQWCADFNGKKAEVMDACGVVKVKPE